MKVNPRSFPAGVAPMLIQRRYIVVFPVVLIKLRTYPLGTQCCCDVESTSNVAATSCAQWVCSLQRTYFGQVCDWSHNLSHKLPSSPDPLYGGHQKSLLSSALITAGIRRDNIPEVGPALAQVSCRQGSPEGVWTMHISTDKWFIRSEW